MKENTKNNILLDTDKIIGDIIASIPKERERQIIAKRYGLYERRETLAQIGEMLGLTRERVRQLEIVILKELKRMANGELPHIESTEAAICEYLSKTGKVAKISDLATAITKKGDKTEQSRIAFLSILAPGLDYIEENDAFHSSVSIAKTHSRQSVMNTSAEVVKAIKKIGEPAKIEAVTGAMGHNDHAEVKAHASISKNLATLNNMWGLIKWPLVNPKNIRDKIFIVLHSKGSHMHFDEISKSIKEYDFKKNNITTQAIHNELIKDPRFVLVGRGMYALKDWGYTVGTVADVIESVMREAGEALHRDDIIVRVKAKRFVKDTTILLNLQSKERFIRTAKSTYALAE
jgi:DNA-binding phage protein